MNELQIIALEEALNKLKSSDRYEIWRRAKEDLKSLEVREEDCKQILDRIELNLNSENVKIEAAKKWIETILRTK